jgi:flagellar operon protein
MADRPFLYPNVTSVPGSRIESDKLEKKKPEGVKSDFDHVMDSTLEVQKDSKGLGKELESSALDRTGGLKKDLGSIKQPLKFSAHASQRLAERKLTLDSATMSKVTDAIDKAEAKGIEDTLVLTNDAALIVNVKNRTVITAMDKQSLTGNVFTNIDGAVII